MSRRTRHIHARANEWVVVHRRRPEDSGCGCMILLLILFLILKGCA